MRRLDQLEAKKARGISCLRGVARRRPRGPGLNLKMLRKITIHKPRSFLQEIPYCHVEHCLLKSLLLASLRSPDTKFTYLCLHM